MTVTTLDATWTDSTWSGNPSWAVARDDTTGLATTGFAAITRNMTSYSIFRAHMAWDASGIAASQVVTAVSLKIYPDYILQESGGINVVGDGANVWPKSAEDSGNYNKANYNFTDSLGSADAPMGLNAYNTLVLDSAAVTQVQAGVGGRVAFTVLHRNDFADTEPGAGTQPNYGFHKFDEANPPQLVITHGDPAPAEIIAESLAISQTVSTSLAITQTVSESLAISQTIEKELIV